MRGGSVQVCAWAPKVRDEGRAPLRRQSPASPGAAPMQAPFKALHWASKRDGREAQQQAAAVHSHCIHLTCGMPRLRASSTSQRPTHTSNAA